MPTVEQLIRSGAAELEESDVFFGHGTDNAFDEAAELVFFALGLDHANAAKAYKNRVNEDEEARVRALLRRRIDKRVPAAYLTNRMWFCGYEFYVDSRVLVPRSPIAELIESEFMPWLTPDSIRRVLDIGTGSGCIAIATALALPQVHVDAADVSTDALAVAAINIERHRVSSRVTTVRSDVFNGVAGRRYDLIVSNPPYVSRAEVNALPPEYRSEPELGLLAGDDGLSIVKRILSEAHDHLEPHGALIVEVGDTEFAVADAYPNVPFTWLEFARGGGGVFVLTAEQLAEYRQDLR
jgi:ribosomal protein L3 glutamine methyltransferase